MADDAELREAAKARGFRLVKSRRRKPGGDFGRYGLVDSKGRECMGFGKDGLTATAEEVHSYLRGGEVASWKRSLIGVVGEPEPKSRNKKEEPPPAPPAKAGGESPQRKSAPPQLRGGAGGGSSSASTSEAKDQDKPELAIREASRRDAAALAQLLGLPASTLAERLAAAVKAGEPPLVAERGDLIGAAAWTVVSTLQNGPVGRITLLEVVEADRRQGVGTQLLVEAEKRLAEAGVSRIEMQLDIDFDAPTGFLRHTRWQRTTNGYGKTVSARR